MEIVAAYGDCGSWVINRVTGDLHGIIVLGYPGTNTGYIIPAIQIFKDIQQTTGLDIKLPNSYAPLVPSLQIHGLNSQELTITQTANSRDIHNFLHSQTLSGEAEFADSSKQGMPELQFQINQQKEQKSHLEKGGEPPDYIHGPA